MIGLGTKFPDFKLQNQDGEWIKLNDFKGRWLVLYVYPKDDTPGCTIQGKSFTSSKDQFTKLGVSVVGLSEDDVGSHKSFCNKFSFNFDLLADPKKELLSVLGIKQSEWKGVLYWERTTFIIDGNGITRKIYENVTPQDHEQVLLQELNELVLKK